MRASSRKNLQEFIDTHHGDTQFPTGFTIEMFDKLKETDKKAVISGISANFRSLLRGNTVDSVSLTTAAFKKVNDDFKFTLELHNTLVGIVNKVIGIQVADVNGNVKISWNDIDAVMQSNFKKWLGTTATKFDKRFTTDLFDNLSDDIKVKFYFALANKFKIFSTADLKLWKLSSTTMIEKVSTLKISDEIQNAILDIIPISNDDLVKLVGKQGADIGSLSKEEIEAARALRKDDSKMDKLKGAAKSVTSLDAYTTLFNDPLFNRDILEIVLKRMEHKTAFKVFSPDTKDIIKVIVTNPIVTNADLLRIRKMKDVRKKIGSFNMGGGPLYTSSHLNTALANSDETPKEITMSLVKLAQIDVKIKALGRKDLTKDDIDVIIDYAIRQHSHMPEQFMKILDAAKKPQLLNDPKTKQKIIVVLKSKYSQLKNSWSKSPSGLVFLETMDQYGWLDDLSDTDKKDMGKVISESYKKGTLSKERIVKLIGKLKSDASSFLLQLYQDTGDASFLPKAAQDIFLF